MADSSTTPGGSTALEKPQTAASGTGTQAQKQQAPQEPRLEVEDLVEGFHELGATDPSVVQAALSGSRRKTHTIKQAQELVTEHLAREVTLDQALADAEHDDADDGEE